MGRVQAVETSRTGPAGARAVGRRGARGGTVAALAILAVLIVLSQDTQAQDAAAPPAPHEPIPPVRAVYLRTPLTLDGRLDEAVYDEVTPTSGFIQQEPHEGQPATEPTDVWVLFDDTTLYVSVRMWDSHPERILASEMRRDNGGISLRDESFSVVIDTFRDRRTGFLFIINPLGAAMDGSVTNEREYNGNFDPVWRPHAGRFDRGWSLELAIPFKSLRYPSAGEQDWAINFRRVVRWKNEVSHLTPIPPSYGLFGINRLTQTVPLVGLRTPAAGKNLEVKPYGISRLSTDRLASPPQSQDLDGSAGFDVKYGLTRAITADFTYNTDFAQVEDDQQQVNLTRFSLF